MKKNLLFVIALIAICGTVLAQDYPSYMEITVAGTNDALTVDGFPDEDVWAGAEVLTYDYTFQETMPEASDVSAELQVAWSTVGILMFLSVTDDVENYLSEGDNSWEQDNCEVFFYFGEEGTWGADAEVAAVSGDTMFSQVRAQLTDDYETSSDGRYLGNWGGPPVGSADTGAYERVAVTSGSGWDIEAILPWALFPKMFYTPATGVKFGFESTIGDADETIRDYQLSLLNDCGTDAAYDNKKYLNTAILGEGVSTIRNHYVNAISVYPTLVDNMLHLKGDVNSLTIYNVTGQTILSVKEDNISTVDVSGLKSGIYFVELNNTITQKIVVR